MSAELLPQRLRKRVEFWKEIGASEVVIRWIEEGYDIPCRERPARWMQKNRKGAFEHAEFLDGYLPQLVAQGAVQELAERPWGVSPLNVVPKATPGKFRLILDLRELNKHLQEFTFNMETLHRRRSGFRRGDWMFSIDLESGYFHLPIRPEDRTLLGFEWRGRWYVFCVLPFGLSSAPFAFTKLMKQLANHWRRKGVRLLVYLDDWCFMERSPEAASSLVTAITADMEAAGLLINREKSALEPSQRIRLLGFWVNSKEGTFRIPEERKEKIMQQLREAETGKRMKVRELASLAGRIMSCFLALGPVTRIFTREMYACVELRSGWRDSVELTPGARREMRFWRDTLSRWDGEAIWPTKLVRPRVLHVDASDSGWGGWQEGLQHFDACEYFTPEEAAESSTVREMLGLERLLRLLRPEELRGQQVLVYTDNQGVASIIRHGSPVPRLNEIAARIFMFCAEHGTFLRVRWVPREENVRADELSKFRAPGDWALNREWFLALDRRWGPHDVDRMANAVNTQCAVFNSKWRCQGSGAVDCFTQHWGGHNNWVCPEFSMVEAVLWHMRECGAEGTVIVPVWDTEPWWGLICANGRWAPVVQDAVWLPREQQLFVAEHEGAMLGVRQHHFDVAVGTTRNEGGRENTRSGRVNKWRGMRGDTSSSGRDNKWRRGGETPAAVGTTSSGGSG